MDWYGKLGVRPVINAAGRYTYIGGSVMHADVLDAMVAASRAHVDIHDLHRKVGQRLAELTNNEAAYVTCGAGAGIVLSVLACRTGTDEVVIRRVAEGRATSCEVVLQRTHRVPYIPAVTLAGATVVEAGSLMRTDRADIDAAISERTVAVLYVAGEHLRRGSLSLEETTSIAHERGVPVIVDAAAQLPPAENLWHFTREIGADLALFSGGKDLGGPQASGLAVGRAELIEAMRRHGSPHQRLARALKVGREEIIGLLAAVDRYVRMDESARRAGWDVVLARWAEDLDGVPGVRIDRSERNEAGQPIPRLLVSWPERPKAPTSDDIVSRLLDGEPSVAVAQAGPQTIGLTPEIVRADESALVGHIVKNALVEIMTNAFAELRADLDGEP